MKRHMQFKSNNKVVQFIAWFCAIIAVVVCISISWWSYSLRPVTSKQNEYSSKILIPSGTTVKEAADKLQKEKVIRSSLAFYIAARLRLYDNHRPFLLKSGVYTVRSSMGIKEIYMLLQSGSQEYVTVRIPEGLTMTKIATLLDEDGVCSKEEFLSACKSSKLLSEYGIPSENFEGYLFPDTYFLTPGMSGAAVVRKFVDTFKLKVSTIESLKKYTPEQLHRVVILASIVEREYRVESEAPVIASVFTNRIKKNIGLYSCATIEYIITEIQGRPHPERITYNDLKIDNRYNTYKWAGLTPGPISNPGMVALTAAASPANTNYYYFVLTDKQKGTHTFSTNFNTHIAAENGYYTKQAAGRK